MDDDLKGMLGQLLKAVEAVDAKVTALQADVADLKTGQRDADTQFAVLQAAMDELRRVGSANHFRLMDRIEEVRDMMMSHLRDHDHPAGDGRRSA